MSYKFHKPKMPQSHQDHCKPDPICPEEKPPSAVFFCAGEKIPLESVGLVEICLTDGSIEHLAHGDMIPANISGFVAMDPVTHKLKYIPGKPDIEQLKTIFLDCVDERGYVNQDQLAAAIGAIDIPEAGLSEEDAKNLFEMCISGVDFVDSQQLADAIASIGLIDSDDVKAIVNDCLLSRGYVSAVDVCTLLDEKIPKAIDDVDLSIDSAEVNAYVQEYLNNFDYVSLAQVKGCINEALDAYDPDPNRDVIKSIVVDCFKDVIDDLVKDGYSVVESGSLTCSDNGQLTITLRQTSAPDITLAGDLSKFINEPVDDTDNFSFVESGTLTCTDNGQLIVSLQQSGAPDISFIGDLSKFLNEAIEHVDNYSFVDGGTFLCDASGNVTLYLNQTGAAEDVVINADFSKFIQTFVDTVSVVESGQIVCNDLGLVTITINQSGANPVVINGDFSKYLSNGLTEAEVQQIVTQQTETLNQCLTGFNSTVVDNQVNLTIQQLNCQPISTSFMIPAVDTSGDVVNQVTGLTISCNDVGIVSWTLTQVQGGSISGSADFSKFIDDVPTTDQIEAIAKVIALQCIIDNQAVDNCINGFTHTINNNVLTSTITQDGCTTQTATVTLPAGAVTSGSMICSPAGVLTTTLVQSDAAPVTYSADLTKFFDDTVSTVSSGTMVCADTGIVTTTLVQSNGPTITYSSDLSKLLNSDNPTSSVVQQGSSLTCDDNNLLSLTLSQTNANPVTVSADMSKLEVFASDFSCEYVVDTAAPCNEYMMLNFKGEPISDQFGQPCRLMTYRTPTSCSMKRCYYNLTGIQSVQIETLNNTAYTIDFGHVTATDDGITSGNNTTGPVTHDFGTDPISGCIEITLSDPCDDVTLLQFSQALLDNSEAIPVCTYQYE